MTVTGDRPTGGATRLPRLSLRARITAVATLLVAVALVALPVVGATATPLGVLLGVVLGLIYGTVAFVAWVTFGLIGLRLLGHLPDPAVAAYRD